MISTNTNIQKISTISALMIIMIWGFACSSSAPIGYSNHRYERPYNQVVFTDAQLGSRISVDNIGSNRTATNTLEVWTNLRNLSRYSGYDLAIRTHFFDRSQRELEVTEWQFIYLTKLGLESYRTQSIHRNIDSYYIEVKKIQRSEWAQQEKKNKPIKNRNKKSATQPKSPGENHFAFGTGYGCSYAGLGVKLQYETSISKARLALHIGGGYFPEGRGWFSANEGIKLYLFHGLYMDALFGFFDAYVVKDSTDTVIEEGRLYGPSVLLGYDLNLSPNLGLNLGAGVAYDMNHKNETIPTFDAGLFLGF